MLKTAGWEHKYRMENKALNEAKSQLEQARNQLAHAKRQCPAYPAPTAYLTAPPMAVLAPRPMAAGPSTPAGTVPPVTATRPRLVNQKIDKPKTPEEDEEAKEEQMKQCMMLAQMLAGCTAEMASRYAPQGKPSKSSPKRGPKATGQPTGPPGLELEQMETGGASGSVLARTEEDYTGGEPGPKIGDMATADMRLDDQGLGVRMPTPQEQVQPEDTAKETAEAVAESVLEDTPEHVQEFEHVQEAIRVELAEIVMVDNPTVDQVHETGPNVEVHPQAESKTSKDENELVNMTIEEHWQPVNKDEHEDEVLNEQGEPVFGGAKE